jgi:hypothetical protein
MIFASGKLRKDSWVETVTGTIEDENMVVSITATREDNGITTTRSFSVDKAKRMGLWVTSTQANSTDGWKYKKSAWFKTPDRMLFYRCLGNLARDLFSDVLLNMYTTEEAVDIQNDTTTIVETESGAKITIPDKEHAKTRSGKMTDRVADKIPDNKFGKVEDKNIQEAEVIEEKFEPQTNLNEVMDAMKTPEKKEESPFIPNKGSSESFNGIIIKRDEEGNIISDAPAEDVLIPGAWTLKQMEGMDTKILLQMINDDTDMIEACEMIEGKNTNKKLREIIFAHQEGRLSEHVAPYLKEDKEKQEQFETSQADITRGEIPPSKDFDKKPGQQGTPTKNADLLQPEKKVEAGNKYSIDVSAYDKGDSREFSTVKTLFNKLMGVTPQITTPRYMELAEKLGLLKKYPDKEGFLKFATSEEINTLLNAN